MYYISIDECIQINKWAIENYGHEFGVIDKAKLNQCLEIPKQVFFGSEIHSSIEKKAATYLYYLTVFHLLWMEISELHSSQCMFFLLEMDIHLSLNKKNL